MPISTVVTMGYLSVLSNEFQLASEMRECCFTKPGEKPRMPHVNCRRASKLRREADKTADMVEMAVIGKASFPRLRVDSFAVGDGSLELIILLLRPAAAVFGEVVDRLFLADCHSLHTLPPSDDCGLISKSVSIIPYGAIERNGQLKGTNQ